MLSAPRAHTLHKQKQAHLEINEKQRQGRPVDVPGISVMFYTAIVKAGWQFLDYSEYAVDGTGSDTQVVEDFVAARRVNRTMVNDQER